MIAADFNGDGKPDIAFVGDSSAGGVEMLVMLNTTPAGAGAPSFSAATAFALNRYSFYVGIEGALVSADFNGDGRPDVALDGTGTVLLDTTPAGAATPSFAASQDQAVVGYAAAADFNGDGKPDLAISGDRFFTVSTPTGTIARASLPIPAAILANLTTPGAGSATFGAPQSPDASNGRLTGPLATADFDGDGRPDLVVGDGAYNENAIFVLFDATPAGASTLSFTGPGEFADGLTSPGAIVATDFNGDGKPDLVLLGYRTVAFMFDNAQAAAGASANPLNFTATFDGAETDATEAITNTGGYELHLGQATLAGPDPQDFAIRQDACSGQSLAAAGSTGQASYPGAGSAPPGGSCAIVVAFKPTAVGPRSAQLRIPSNDPTSPTVITLNGTGEADKVGGNTHTTGTVKIPAQTDVVDAKGHLTVTLQCAGAAACSGTLTLTHSARASARGKHKRVVTTVLAGKRYTVKPGRRTKVAMTLKPVGLHLLRAARGKLTVTAVAASRVAGRTHTVKRSIKLARALPRKHHKRSKHA